MDKDEIRKLANSGDVDAIYQLGLMYESGSGVMQNTSIALKRFRQAASKGHKGAEAKLEELSNQYNLNYDKKRTIPKQKIEFIGDSSEASAPIVQRDLDLSPQLHEHPVSASHEVPHDDITPDSKSGYRSLFIGFGSIMISGIWGIFMYGVSQELDVAAPILGVIIAIIGGALGFKDLQTFGEEQIAEGEKKFGKRKFMLIAGTTICIIGLATSLAIPGIHSTRLSAESTTCEAQCKSLDTAILAWMTDKKMNWGDEVAMEDLVVYYDGDLPECPAGGEYLLTSEKSEKCTCSVHTKEEEDE